MNIKNTKTYNEFLILIAMDDKSLFIYRIYLHVNTLQINEYWKF